MLGAGKVCISCVEYQCCPWGFSEICSFAFCFILGAQGNYGMLAKIELPQMKAFFTPHLWELQSSKSEFSAYVRGS